MLLRCYLLLLCLLFLKVPSFAFSNQKPNILNFTREKYHGASKNWDIGQDDKGFMYFGNDIGLLESDGLGWRLHTIPTAPIVRALAVESHNVIYTGGLDELGRWDRDLSGKLIYTSLTNLLPPKSMHNESIWRIWIDGAKIYFQSFSNIYVYDHIRLDKLTMDKGFMLLTKVKDEFWVQEMHGNLYRLHNSVLSKIEGTEFLNKTVTRVILPYKEDKYLLGTSTGELYIYDKGQYSLWNKALTQQLEGLELNCAVFSSKRNTYFLGTQLDGIYEVDIQGNILNHFNATNGLQNNTILAMHEDKSHNLWIAMDRGLAYIQYTHGLSYYLTTGSFSRSVYAAIIWNEYLILGTNQGVFYTKKENINNLNVYSSLKLIDGTEGQTWSFSQLGDKLFCCHNKGVLEILPDLSTRKAFPVDSGVFSILETNVNNQKAIIIIGYKDIYIFNKTTGDLNRISKIDEPISSVQLDHLGNIWLETVSKGVYKCKLNDRIDDFHYSKYYGHEIDTSLPTHLRVAKASGRIVFFGDDLIYAYDENDDKIKPSSLLNTCFNGVKDLKRIIPIGRDENWAMTENSIYHFSYDGYIARINESYMIEKHNISFVTASENISVLNDSLSLICLDMGFILHNSKQSKHQNTQLSPPNIEYIQFRRDVNTDTYANLSEPIEIPYNENTVSIGFSVNNTFADNLTVEYLLEGVDDAWTKPELSNSVSYARLAQGKYTLHLRTTDQLGNYSSCTSVDFEVLPPWYNTIWWYLICFLLFCLIVFVVFIYMQRYWQNKHLRIANHQLQSEIEKKDAEMFTQTSFIIRKNESVLKIKDMIDELSDKNTQKQLLPQFTKINTLITNSLDVEGDWKMFLIKFEEKHQNFFKSLMKSYPALTNYDLRLCACLKLNMDTKDIAALMSLSIRAVENNRYRLRKKLDLESHQNLNEFFLHFD